MTPLELADWLRDAESCFGGKHSGVPRRIVSRYDPRTAKQLARGGMQGGDRMNYHKYADDYAAALMHLETKFAGGVVRGLPLPEPSPHDPHSRPPRVHHGHRMQPKTVPLGRAYADEYAEIVQAANEAAKRLTVVELGILRGIGLAIWCELFEDADIIGLDVDVTHFRGHSPVLKRRGAFRRNRPSVYEFDELAPERGERLAQILDGSTIDLMIDDALHYDDAILTAMRTFMPHMADDGVYVVEDNEQIHAKIAREYPDWSVKSSGALTVLRRK